jgi:microcompartment protein CcmK/EutM
MKTCRVIGKAQATVKHPSLEGVRLLVVREVDGSAKLVGAPFLAVDIVGSGEGEMVAVAMGSAVSSAFAPKEAPLDAAIVAILDSVVIDGKEIYSREEEKI